MQNGNLKVAKIGRGVAWLDTGTSDSLLSAGRFVQTIEQRQGLKIACIEEIAYKNGFINKDQFCTLAERYAKSTYGQYLQGLLTAPDWS